MSEGLEGYRESERTISADSPAGDLAEILSKPTVEEEYPSDSKLIPSVDLDGKHGNDLGEFDYVVLNQDSNVIGVVEVKHANDNAGKAKRDLKKAMRGINDGRVDSVSDDLSPEDFTESDDIKRLKVGPSSDKQRVEESNIPEHSLSTYDNYIYILIVNSKTYLIGC